MAEDLLGGLGFVVGRLECGCLLVGLLFVGEGECNGCALVDDVL